MRKKPAPIKWEVVDFALIGGVLGIAAGAVFCCVQMVISGADFHLVRDLAFGAVVGVLLLGTLALIRNWIVRAT
jgi:hypothetical protein